MEAERSFPIVHLRDDSSAHRKFLLDEEKPGSLCSWARSNGALCHSREKALSVLKGYKIGPPGSSISLPAFQEMLSDKGQTAADIYTDMQKPSGKTSKALFIHAAEWPLSESTCGTFLITQTAKRAQMNSKALVA